MSNVFLFCNTTSVLHIIPSVLAKRGRDGVWHGFLLRSSHRRLVSFLSSLINSLLSQACLAEGKFFVCDQISPIPDGKLLLNYIRNVSFTSKSLPFNLADIVNPNLVFVTTQQSQYSEDCTRLCHRNTENNSLRLHLSGAAIQFSSIYTFEEHYVQQQIILICNKRRKLLAAPPSTPAMKVAEPRLVTWFAKIESSGCRQLELGTIPLQTESLGKLD